MARVPSKEGVGPGEEDQDLETRRAQQGSCCGQDSGRGARGEEALKMVGVLGTWDPVQCGEKVSTETQGQGEGTLRVWRGRRQEMQPPAQKGDSQERWAGAVWLKVSTAG